jgi:phosphopantothenoylcysteine decarboxylase/phosphopantothenate--cysteine ligase
MTTLADKRIILGVGGGIAAYKAPMIVRALTQAGAQVRVVLTESATQFVAPLALQAVSGNPVGTSLFDPGYEHQIGHIELARWADAVIVAPATANLLARMAHGMADDLLTTVLLATTAPVLVCPAMNTQMLGNAAVQANLQTVASHPRTTILDPDEGLLACGEVGSGRLPDADVILEVTGRMLGSGLLRDRRVVVTAGPTREAFDAVRFLSNRSSGKMGYALAAAAWRAGASVVLISGPVTLTPPHGVQVVSVTTAAEMRAAVLGQSADILIMAAAVADYRPASPLAHKRKKSDAPWTPEFERTRDILADVATAPNRPALVVGFAAETEDVAEYASDKMARKRLDGIVGNNVSGPGGAFESDSNTVIMLSPASEPIHAGPASKQLIARTIVEWIATLRPHGATHE